MINFQQLQILFGLVRKPKPLLLYLSPEMSSAFLFFLPSCTFCLFSICAFITDDYLLLYRIPVINT